MSTDHRALRAVAFTAGVDGVVTRNPLRRSAEDVYTYAYERVGYVVVVVLGETCGRRRRGTRAENAIRKPTILRRRFRRSFARAKSGRNRFYAPIAVTFRRFVAASVRMSFAPDTGNRNCRVLCANTVLRIVTVRRNTTTRWATERRGFCAPRRLLFLAVVQKVKLQHLYTRYVNRHNKIFFDIIAFEFDAFS